MAFNILKAAYDLVLGTGGDVTSGVSGTAAAFASFFQSSQETSRESLKVLKDLNERLVKSVYVIFLNPLVSGARIPELNDDNVSTGFFEEIFKSKEVYKTNRFQLDTIKMSQIRNIGRRLIFQSRLLAILIHNQPIDLNYDTPEEVNEARNMFNDFYLELQFASSSFNAFYAFLIDSLIATRIGLTMTFALVATIQKKGLDTLDDVVIDDFSNLLRRSIEEYDLRDMAQYIIKKSQKPVTVPVDDQFRQIDLGIASRFASVWNSLERTLSRFNLREEEEGRSEIPLLFDQSKPSDLKPDAIVAQLVHMLNFHSNYAPRLDYVVENFVLKPYQDLEFSFDSSNAESDPNTSLYRAMMFVELGLMEDWSLFCRTTGFFEIQLEEAGGSQERLDELLTQERPNSYLDASYPTILPNDGEVAQIYWGNAWKSIEMFIQFATKENLVSVLSAFTAVQLFHAKQGLTPVTEIKNQNTVFASKDYVQDEQSVPLLWRVQQRQDPDQAAQGVVEITPGIALVPSQSLLFGTIKSLFENLFSQPDPYRQDGFQPNEFSRTSVFLRKDNILLMIQTVICGLFQLVMHANALTSFNEVVMEFASRVSQTYHPDNRKELDLLELTDVLVQIQNLIRQEEQSQRDTVVLLFDLGAHIVNNALISSVAKQNSLLYPPPIADMCRAWLDLYVTSFTEITAQQQNDQSSASRKEKEEVEEVQAGPSDTQDETDQELPLCGFQFDSEKTVDLLVIIQAAFEQLKAIKLLLDPKDRMKRNTLAFLDNATERYKKHMVDYYTNPNDTTRNLLSASFQELIEAIKLAENVFNITLPKQVKDAYNRLLEAPQDVREAQYLTNIIQNSTQNFPTAIQRAREILLTYLDLIQLDKQKC